MKRCPQCSQVYTDDLSFCLSDGTPLRSVADAPDEPTVVRPKNQAGSPAPASGTGLWLKMLAGAFILFLGFVILAGIGLWVFWRPGPIVTPKNDGNPATPTPSPTRAPATPQPTATRSDQSAAERDKLERERKRLEDERRLLEEERSREAEPKPDFNDPGVTRISFRRGSVGENVSGTVGRQRSFVLRTLAGQYLSASVRSANGCVTFATGGSSTGFTTNSGDSYLNLRNTCGDPVRFTMSVTVR